MSAPRPASSATRPSCRAASYVIWEASPHAKSLRQPEHADRAAEIGKALGVADPRTSAAVPRLPRPARGQGPEPSRTRA
ncbi:MAG: hypothetical protein M0C28_20830 [Candidatus Moduliflexus flocculans]|nr:hypothetical protein [Candidatus Moduliflexus flocculans]